MAVESTTAARWDELYRDERHWLAYPSEHVVRWAMSLPNREGTALDIGCGSGRHMNLLSDLGFLASGLDRVSARGKARRGDMRYLPYGDNWFDVALSYGVFYYGTEDDMLLAVSEMHRVMRPGGHGFLCLRSNLDWRARHLVDGVLDIPGEPEHGMQMTFLDGRGLHGIVLAPFKEYEVNMTTTTTHDGARANCDWLVSVTK